jgi:hypothetical protein
VGKSREKVVCTEAIKNIIAGRLLVKDSDREGPATIDSVIFQSPRQIAIVERAP